MESIHVLEPVFQISAGTLRIDRRTGWMGAPHATDSPCRAGTFTGGAIGRLAFLFLERLRIVNAPRIISAECLLTDTLTTAGDCR